MGKMVKPISALLPDGVQNAQYRTEATMHELNDYSMTYDIWVGASIGPAVSQQIPADTLVDKAFPVLIGALAALIGSVVVQLFIVPAVEIRKRREQRWEQDVREMGELLTFDLSRAVRTFYFRLHAAAIVIGPRTDANARLFDKHEREVKAAAADLNAAGLRLEWLGQRICDIAEFHPRMFEFGGDCDALRGRVMLFETLEWKLRPTSGQEFLTGDEIDASREKLDKGVRDLLNDLKRYGTGAPPRNSIHYRIALKIFQARQRKTGQDAQEDVRHEQS